MSSCPCCDDTGHVCESHPTLPWAPMSGAHWACDCGAPGMPCGLCCDPVPQDGTHNIIECFTPRKFKKDAHPAVRPEE